jgi:hypothetical protein
VVVAAVAEEMVLRELGPVKTADLELSSFNMPILMAQQQQLVHQITLYLEGIEDTCGLAQDQLHFKKHGTFCSTR